MEAVKDLKRETEDIRNQYVTHRHLDAVIPALQKTLDEVKSDIKQLLVIVHNSNGKKAKPENN